MTTANQPLTVTLRRMALGRDGGGLTDGQLLGEFVHTGDPLAFEALVRRHEAMVFGVCRRVVGDRHAAEDAFQAVWLVLARRAATVRPREHVGNWLFGVSYRTALKARGTRARRSVREKQVSTMRHHEAPVTVAAWADVAPVIDAELARLPDALRLPVVLCDLEGRPQRDAARHLGLPVTTLVNRLLRARRLLAKRLTDRGVALSGGALAGVLGTYASAQAVPHALTASAVAGAVAGTAPAAAVHLSEGVIRMLAIAKLKPTATAVLVAVGVCVAVGTATLPNAGAQSPGPVAKQPLAHSRGTDDDAFLRKACTDIRGTPATDLERALFQLDPDPKKRTKVVEWLLSEPVPAATFFRDDITYVTESLLQADETPRAALDKGIEWLRIAQHGKVNANDVLPDVQRIQIDPITPVKVDGPGSWKIELLWPSEQKPAENPTKNQGDPTLSRVEQFYWLMAQPQADNSKKADKKAEAAKAQAELDKARVVVFEKTIRRNNAAAAQKRAAAGKPEADLTQIDLEVAEAELAKAEAKLELLGKTQKAKFVETAKSSDDVGFLRRVLTDSRGTAPTALELKYFTEDEDPKKREKVVDLLLKDPAVAKKLGPDWRNKVLGLPVHFNVEVIWGDAVLAESTKTRVRTAGPSAKLLGQVLHGNRTDEQIADAICLATVGRFPTEAEQKMALAAVTGEKDKRSAWAKVFETLASTKEAQAHADALKKK